MLTPLSHELRQSGEVAVSLEECTEVLNSFPLNKVPGARFLKLPIITGSVKLFCFPFQMGVSKGLKVVQ